jgi:HK97 family phage prohead protease
MFPDLEYRFLPIDQGGGETLGLNVEERTFEGFASTFEKPRNHDAYGTIFAPGAFSDTIKARGPEGSNQIRVFWRHQEPLGMPLSLEEKKRGLWVKGYVSKTSLGDDALTFMQDGVVQALSIGFRTLKAEWLEDQLTKWKTPVRRILKAELFEFSPVLFPANPKALLKRGRDALAEEYRSLLSTRQPPATPVRQDEIFARMLMKRLA